MARGTFNLIGLVAVPMANSLARASRIAHVGYSSTVVLAHSDVGAGGMRGRRAFVSPAEAPHESSALAGVRAL